MPFDYTDAPPPSFDLIPDGTVATVSIHVRPGGVGEDDMLKRSANGECEMLDLELTVLDGPYKGRKFWHNLLGMNFVAKIGEEKGGPKKDGGNYADKNVLAGAVTKDKSGWHAVEQQPPFNGGGATSTSSAPTAPVEWPEWAR